MTAVPPAVVDWARLPGPARALGVARRKWEAGTRGASVVLCADADETERRDLGRLVGMDWQLKGRPLTLGGLRRALTSTGVDLPDLLEAVEGPLRDRPAEREAGRTHRAELAARLITELTDAGVPTEVAATAIDGRWLGSWVRAPRRVAAVAAVWPRLPASEGTLVAELAAAALSDPHALDRRFALGGIVLRLQQYARTGTDPGPVRDAFAFRRGWSELGVSYDRVSSLVLVLNLPLPTDTLTGRLCGAAIGEPLWLTYRMLPSGFALAAGALVGVTIRVCENPTVAEAAADRLGERCRPLVCTFGQVSVAAVGLLRALERAGAELLITGDRDTAGVTITAGLLARLPSARPWLPAVDGRYEEDRLDALLADLASGPENAPV